MTRRNKIIIVSGAVLAFVAFGALIFLRAYFVRAIRVPTGSMANTIVPGDCLYAQRLFGDPKRGDIVIFAYPADRSTRYVSRVVGLPGESIQVKGTSIVVNGQPIPEQRVLVEPPADYEFDDLRELSIEGSGDYRVFYYKNRDELMPTRAPEMKFGVAQPFQILPDEYFVMSDNRDNSLDSRVKGPVPRSLIWGKPTIIYWSSHANQTHQVQVKWDRIGKEVK